MFKIMLKFTFMVNLKFKIVQISSLLVFTLGKPASAVAPVVDKVAEKKKEFENGKL